MAYSKVVYDGDTLIDLTEDTVTAEALAAGATAHNAAGEEIIGVLPVYSVVPPEHGGTGADNGANGLANLLAAGYTVLSPYQVGTELPASAPEYSIFIKIST